LRVPSATASARSSSSTCQIENQSMCRNRDLAWRRGAGRLRQRPDGPRSAEGQVSANTTVHPYSGLQPEVSSPAA
jgi:hypothetical protein